MEQTCVACGMPMNEAADHAMGNSRKDYCLHCARTDGSMQGYDEKLESFADFMVRTQGLDKEAATAASRELMSNLPAWKDRDRG